MDLFNFPEMGIDKPIRLIELFAGIGAQAKALERIGANFEHWRAVEFDPNPIAMYNDIHKTCFAPSDITKIHAADLGIVDTDKYDYIMTYSFPCQDLSSNGKRAGLKKGSNTRSGLLWGVERLLNECVSYNGNLPKVLLMENVDQVHNRLNIDSLEDWCTFLRKLGYTNYCQDLNATYFGIPQNRLRCFMVSVLGEYSYVFPKQEFLTSLCAQDFVEASEEEPILYNNHKNYFFYPDVEISKHRTRKIEVVGTFRDRKRINKKNGFGAILNSMGYVSTICASRTNNVRVLYKDKVCVLTNKQCFLLMGFDVEDWDAFMLSGNDYSPSALIKAIGNSIVVNVLEAIFRNMNIKGVEPWK